MPWIYAEGNSNAAQKWFYNPERKAMFVLVRSAGSSPYQGGGLFEGGRWVWFRWFNNETHQKIKYVGGVWEPWVPYEKKIPISGGGEREQEVTVHANIEAGGELSFSAAGWYMTYEEVYVMPV